MASDKDHIKIKKLENELNEIKPSYQKYKSALLEAEDSIKQYKLEISKINDRFSILENKSQEQEEIIKKQAEVIQHMRLINRVQRIFNLFKPKPVINVFSKIILKTRNYIHHQRYRKRIVDFQRTKYAWKFSGPTPLVSIIIINKDGAKFIHNFIESLVENTIYPNYEIIVIDNNSSDNSIEIIKKLDISSLKIIKKNFNDTCAKIYNEASIQADGQLLLFLKNDVIPIKGWLSNLVISFNNMSSSKIGVIGSKLIYLGKNDPKMSLKLKHTGITFKYEKAFMRPVFADNGVDFFSRTFEQDEEKLAISGACMLISKERFEEIEGFEEKYLFDFEDIDLCLKLHSKGYQNYVCAGSALFYNEKISLGRSSEGSEKSNMSFFRDNWYRYLLNGFWDEVLNQTKNSTVFSSKVLNVGFVVTETGSESTAGDYFTANELSIQFKSFGWSVNFISSDDENKYNIDSDIDILIVMLHDYDLSKIICANESLIKVAWIRNWFDQYVESNGFLLYDIVLASSLKACEFINKKTGMFARYFPIATNQSRFSKQTEYYDKSLECDYCFTGNYWDDPREIIEMLKPEKLPEYKFHLYGKNWEKIDSLRIYYKGFFKYDMMPYLYSNTKILIDDANRVTKPWGSVNSRVFDALMCDVLVISNGSLGSEDIFGGALPVYSTSEELISLLRFYLNDENERLNKIKELKNIIETRHTYIIRANAFVSILKSHFSKSVVIKAPVPNLDEAYEWGDYHFALSLKKNFQRNEYRVLIQFLDEWYNEQAFEFQHVLVIRGLNRYVPYRFQQNYMWNISHPNEVTFEEYECFDHSFIASKKWTEFISKNTSASVSYLPQCVDDEVFYTPETDEKIDHQLLFVGNSRKLFRKIIKDLIPTNYNLSIYGKNWEGFVKSSLIKGEHIPNRELYKYYGGCSILLNDHWDDMKEKGFISNRLFDALACEAIVISDRVDGIEEIFDGAIATYSNKNELHQLVESYMNKENHNRSNITKVSQIIRKNHTFKNRVNQIIEFIENKS